MRYHLKMKVLHRQNRINTAHFQLKQGTKIILKNSMRDSARKRYWNIIQTLWSYHRLVFRGFWWVHRGTFHHLTAISIRLRSWYWKFIIKFNGFLWWSWHVIMPWFFRKFWFMVDSTTGWVSFQRHFSDSCVCGRFVFRGGRTSGAQLDFLLSKVNARGWGFDPLPWWRKVVGGQKSGLRTRVSRPPTKARVQFMSFSKILSRKNMCTNSLIIT